jgi:hypothetical protein
MVERRRPRVSARRRGKTPGPSPLASNGLPYEIEGFQSAGMMQPDDAFFEKGDPGKIDRGGSRAPIEKNCRWKMRSCTFRGCAVKLRFCFLKASKSAYSMVLPM